MLTAKINVARTLYMERGPVQSDPSSQSCNEANTNLHRDAFE